MPRLLVCLLLPVTVLLAGPAQLYFTNAAEFSATFSQHLLLLAPAALAVFALLAVVLAVAAQRSGPACLGVALLFAVSVLVWLQGNLLVFDYGPLDGRGVRFSGKAVHSAVEVAIWCAGIAAAVCWRKSVARVAPAGAALLLFMQLGSVSFESMRAAPAREWRPAAQMRDALHTLAPDNNVILLLLDTFQGDAFRTQLDRDPSLASRLDGFTLFANTLGGYPTTAASLPLMLSGIAFHNDRPVAEFVERVLKGNSMPRAYLDAGYQVDLMPLTRFVMDCHREVSSNCLELRRAAQEDDRAQALDEAVRLLDVSLFRHVPHVIKPHVYNDDNWLLAEHMKDMGVAAIVEGYGLDGKFIDAFRASSTVSDALDGTFKLFHLGGLHPPYKLDAQCSEQPADQRQGIDERRRAVDHQARCVLLQLDQFITRLESLGLYESSLLVVAGDHGTIGDLHYRIDTEAMDRHAISAGAQGAGTAAGAPSRPPPGSAVLSSSLPMLLIKPPGASGPLAVNHAPVSLCDLPRTMARLSGLSTAFPCQDAFALDEQALRARRYLYYSWDFWDADYLPNMREYEVLGVPWRAASWTSTGRLFSPAGVTVDASTEYRHGDVLQFGAGGSVVPYLVRGWEQGDDGRTWAMSPEAGLSLPLGTRDSASEEPRARWWDTPGALDGDAVIRMRFGERGTASAPVEVYFNDQLVTTWHATAAGLYEARGALAQLTRPRLEVSFRSGTALADEDGGQPRPAFSPDSVSLSLER